MARERCGVVLIYALCALLFGTALASGQTPDSSTVSRGDRVRVTARPHSPERIEGTLVAQGEEMLTIVPRGDHATVQVPRAHVTKLEVARGKKSHWLAGALAGAAVGLVVGAAACSALQCQGPGSETQSVAMTTFLGTATGALVGTLIRTDHWVTVPHTALEARVESSSGQSLRLSVRLSF